MNDVVPQNANLADQFGRIYIDMSAASDVHPRYTCRLTTPSPISPVSTRYVATR